MAVHALLIQVSSSVRGKGVPTFFESCAELRLVNDDDLCRNLVSGEALAACIANARSATNMILGRHQCYVRDYGLARDWIWEASNGGFRDILPAFQNSLDFARKNFFAPPS